MAVFCSSSRVEKSSHPTCNSIVTVVSNSTTGRSGSGMHDLVGVSDGASDEWLLGLEEGEKVRKLGEGASDWRDEGAIDGRPSWTLRASVVAASSCACRARANPGIANTVSQASESFMESCIYSTKE
jgi:hypothetical protein